MLRNSRRYSSLKTVINFCCSAWSVRMVSCYSRNYHLWLRTKISIEGPVVPVGIVTTVPGFEGLMKSVLVIFR